MTMAMPAVTLPEMGRSDLSMPPLKIAVEGCVSYLYNSKHLTTFHAHSYKGHGSLDNIYTSLEKACESRGWSVAELDFLIICGDFQESALPFRVRLQLLINRFLGCSQRTRFELHVRPLEISAHW